MHGTGLLQLHGEDCDNLLQTREKRLQIKIIMRCSRSGVIENLTFLIPMLGVQSESFQTLSNFLYVFII